MLDITRIKPKFQDWASFCLLLHILLFHVHVYTVYTSERGHIEIVEKEQETSWNTYMHNTVHLCHHHTT